MRISSQTRLNLGKISPEVLEKIIFQKLAAKGRGVLIGPDIGLDFAVCKPRTNRVMISHIDAAFQPKDSPELLGYESVCFCANDIATSGAKPDWMMLSLLLPEGSTPDLVQRILQRANSEAKKYSVSLIGGHTAVYPGVSYLISATAMIGFVEKSSMKTVSRARNGDSIIMCGHAGDEAVSVCAYWHERKLARIFSKELASRIKKLVWQRSIIGPARILSNIPAVSSMHDLTEGGLAQALAELSIASGNGAWAFSETVPVRRDVLTVCGRFGIDPLRATSTGALIATVRSASSENAVGRLRSKGFAASVIGELADRSEGVRLTSKDKEAKIILPIADEGWKLYELVTSS